MLCTTTATYSPHVWVSFPLYSRPSVLWHCWLGGRKGIRPVKDMGDGGGRHWLLVRMEWCPSGWSLCLPLLIFPCTIKSRSSLLAPAHPGGLGKRDVKWLWWWWCIVSLHTAASCNRQVCFSWHRHQSIVELFKIPKLNRFHVFLGKPSRTVPKVKINSSVPYCLSLFWHTLSHTRTTKITFYWSLSGYAFSSILSPLFRTGQTKISHILFYPLTFIPSYFQQNRPTATTDLSRTLLVLTNVPQAHTTKNLINHLNPMFQTILTLYPGHL